MKFLKNILALLLAAIFCIATSGVSVVYHYCAGELDNISLATQKTCCDNKKKMAKDCCHNEVQYLKVQSDFAADASVHPPTQIIVVAILPTFFSCDVPVAYSSRAHSLLNGSPPVPLDIPIRTGALLI